MHYSHVAHPDIASLKALFLTTFTDSEGAAEGQSVSELVAAILSTTEPSLVEVYTASDSKLEGAIIFTELETSTCHNAYLLSPVAVATSQQGKGVGQALINFACQDMASRGAQLLFTYGDPSFYSKMGFAPLDNTQIVAPQPLSHPHGWLGQSLSTDDINQLAMTMTSVAAFNNPSLW
jgi:predicted N-acetyltransferase YhbS